MVYKHSLIDLSKFQTEDNEFAHLSLKDLIEARDLFHIHLMRHPNVVATAIGRYRIRKGDSWPQERPKRHGTGPRRLDNSEVRPYSWPAILVFVTQWQNPKGQDPRQDPKAFASRAAEMVPSTVFMPDGRRVPICVIEAPRESRTQVDVRQYNHPLNNLGPGSPVIMNVQGQDYLATVGCLVSDGHKIYALTNRHVTGEEGEVVEAILAGERQRVGESASKQLTRLKFSDVYPNLPAADTFVNLDIGLIDVDDISRWTTKVRELGTFAPMADFSGVNLSLSLIGCHVCGVGAASGKMLGEIHALFYRYKTGGGFEYVADLFIGPRISTSRPDRAHPDVGPLPKFATHPGDSGTLWLLEPTRPRAPGGEGDEADGYVPLALQWGRNMLASAEKTTPQSYALATLLSRACALLDVDPVRAWNLDQVDTWGALGHFSIASRTLAALSNNFPKLNALMEANLDIISHEDDVLEEGDFTGMGSEDFVPMADVPDFFWKPRVAKQGFARPLEGGNHFADMDQQGADGQTLLQMTEDDANIDPARWETYYNGIVDLLSGDPVAEPRRGLLPFRVWQTFDAMCDFVKAGETEKFVCAAGVLAHYVGDACQPLHISYLHDGDPTQPVEHTFSKGKKAGQTEKRPLGQGVHSAYEDKMVFDHREEILAGLKKSPKAKKSEYVATGKEAAKRTIDMMRTTFDALPPTEMVRTYVNVGKGGKAASDALWAKFGDGTIETMQSGAHLLAVLWESAWNVGDGDASLKKKVELTQDAAMDIVKDPDFLPSKSIGTIGSVLR